MTIRKKTNLDFENDQPSSTLSKPKVFEQPCRAKNCPCTVYCGQLTQGITVCEFHEVFKAGTFLRSRLALFNTGT